jgi:PAS domain S-box-containing protein
MQKLHEKDVHFKAFMEHSVEGIWCVDFDRPFNIDLPEDEQFDLVYKHGYLSDANDVYARSMGFKSGKELIGRRIEEFAPRSEPKNVAAVKELIRSRYKLKGAETVESYIDGVTRYLLNFSSGIIEDGHLVRVWGTHIDITPLKQLEKALTQSRDFNLAILNSIEDHLAVLDRNGNILAVNEPWVSFASENDADLAKTGIGVNYFEACRKSYADKDNNTNEISQNALKGLTDVLEGKLQKFELEYPCDSPTEERWFKLKAIPFQGSKGGLVVSHHDITKRKVMEKKLIKAEHKYRTVADFTYDWEYWEGSRGRLRYVSPSCERITGYSASDFIKRPELISEIVLPEDQAVWLNHRHGVINRKDHEPTHCHFRVQHKDGSIRWIGHVCQPVFDEMGNFQGIRASNRDITNLRMVEQKVREHRNMLTHLDRRATLGQMTGSIAHELNQPLTGILSDAQAGELLLKKGQLNEENAGSIFKDITADAKRASHILRNLRELFSEGKTKYRSICANELIRDTLKILNSELIGDGVKVITNLSEGLPKVNGKRIQLQQVVINLISNSKQAMQNAQVKDRWLSIQTSSGENDQVMICIEDNGPGIDREKIKDIFNPLFTTKNDGLGMGLAICDTIIQSHGGRIWGENSPKGGAKLIVWLPAETVERP